MCGKLLSVAIPAYNAEQYISKCLDSLTAQKFIGRLDIIVVNDGSKDRTSEMACEYAKRFPESVRVIDKENAGHGSVINVAAEVALGKYFKVIDSDDWVLSDQMLAFLQLLEQTRADVVLTNFHTVHMVTGFRREYRPQGVRFGKEYEAEEYLSLPPKAFTCCTFHGITYRTEFYRKTGIILEEKVFYEDQEYATLPFQYAQTVLQLDLFIYEYLIGNAQQSVAAVNQVQRISQLEQVLWKIVDTYINIKTGISLGRRRYFCHKISELLLVYNTTMMLKNSDRTGGRADVKRIRALLHKKDEELYRNSTRQYRRVLWLSFLKLDGSTLEKLRSSVLYGFFYRMIRR